MSYNWEVFRSTGIRGIDNPGTLCYLNVLLQVIKRINPIVGLLQGIKGGVGQELHRLFLQMDDSTVLIDATILCGRLAFDSKVQQDAHEAYLKLYNTLESDVQMDSVRLGKLKEVFITVTSKAGTQTTQESADRQIVIPANRTLTPGDIFDHEESVTRLPKVLTLQLQIYSPVNGQTIKDTKKVIIPFVLDFSSSGNIVTDTPERIYDLFAVVSHSGGSSNFGHYIVHINAGNKWVKCDDREITSVNEDLVFDGADATTPYLLFYTCRMGSEKQGYIKRPVQEIPTENVIRDSIVQEMCTPAVFTQEQASRANGMSFGDGLTLKLDYPFHCVALTGNDELVVGEAERVVVYSVTECSGSLQCSILREYKGGAYHMTGLPGQAIAFAKGTTVTIADTNGQGAPVNFTADVRSVAHFGESVLAVGTVAGTVHLGTVNGHKIDNVRVFNCESKQVRSMTSLGNNRIVAATADPSIVWWSESEQRNRLDTGRQANRFPGINCLSVITPDCVAAGDMDGKVKGWNVYRRTMLWEYTLGGSVEFLETYAKHTRYTVLASCDRKGNAFLHKLCSGNVEQIANLEPPKLEVDGRIVFGFFFLSSGELMTVFAGGLVRINRIQLSAEADRNLQLTAEVDRLQSQLQILLSSQSVLGEINKKLAKDLQDCQTELRESQIDVKSALGRLSESYRRSSELETKNKKLTKELQDCEGCCKTLEGQLNRFFEVNSTRN